MKNVHEKSSNAFCSIVTLSYLAYAKTLDESLKASGNMEPYYVLVVDYRPEYRELVAASKLNIVTLADLNILDVDGLIEKYTTFEFSNILKPFFVRWLLKNHTEINYLVFLDSDIYVYDTFTELFKYFDLHKEFSALLTPHFISKEIAEEYVKRTDYIIDQVHFSFGLYNSGMMVYRNDKQAMKFLDWHANKTSRFGFNRPENDMFNEQKILDMAPLAFDFVGIYRNKGYNVAPWNYFKGMINKKDNKYYIGNEPLVFFHFSVVHKNDPTNSLPYEVSLQDQALYFELIGNYRDRLTVNGREETLRISYGFLDKYKAPLTLPVPVSVTSLKQDLERAFNEIDQLKRQLQDVYTSHSWRMTHYFRQFLDIMKGVKK